MSKIKKHDAKDKKNPKGKKMTANYYKIYIQISRG
jgi:hypothetical protein